MPCCILYVCPRLRPFSSVFGELALFWCSTAKRTFFQSIFWTDSTVVLHYVKNETRRYHTFAANRVAVILDGSEPRQWKHVCGDMNTADDASRGLTDHIFLRQKGWLLGPEFLWKPEHMWPADGLLRVGGRLCNASLPSESKSQIILPKDDHVTRLIIYEYHSICGHSGREQVLAMIRQKFWII